MSTILERIDRKIDEYFKAKWQAERGAAFSHARQVSRYLPRAIEQVDRGKWVYDAALHVIGQSGGPSRTEGFWLIQTKTGGKGVPRSMAVRVIEWVDPPPCQCEVCLRVAERAAFMKGQFG